MTSIYVSNCQGYPSQEHVEMSLPMIFVFLQPVLSLLPSIWADTLTGFVGGWNGMYQS